MIAAELQDLICSYLNEQGYSAAPFSEFDENSPDHGVVAEKDGEIAQITIVGRAWDQ